MNRRSQAGRLHTSGDQIMVPNVVTRSRKMWLRMPAAHRPNSAGKEGDSHLRQRQIANVSRARSALQTGQHSKECVMLRCQVTMSISLVEKKSRTTSESGKIAPSMSVQVTTCFLLTGIAGKRSPPLNAA